MFSLSSAWCYFFRLINNNNASVFNQYLNSLRKASRHTKFSKSMDQNNQDEYTNPYPDFDGKNGHGIIDLSTQELDQKLLLKIEKAANQFTETVNKEGDRTSDFSVYTGVAGIALLNLLISQRFDDSRALTKAEDLLRRAPQKIHTNRATFLQDSGPVAISAVVAHHLGKSSEAKKHTSRLVSALDDVIASDPEMPDECLYGRVGYLYSLMFVRKHLGPQSIDKSAIKKLLLSDDDIEYKSSNINNKTEWDLMLPAKKVVAAVLRSGKSRSAEFHSEIPLEYEWNDEVYLGAAHGVAGILYMLFRSGVLSAQDKAELIQPTLDSLLGERLPSGNFPSSQGSRRDTLVQWCHGAPGFADLLATAYKEFGDDSYRKLAVEAGEVVWKRGLCTKGYSICHGVSGNAYTFLQLYNLTGDVKHLYRAGCFADWCLSLPKHEQMKPDREFSLFEGLAGVAYFLNDIQHPSKAGFPAYTLQL